jgi:hypothetical protein
MVENKITVEDLAKTFFKLEGDEELYKWEICGVQVWTLIRSKIFMQLASDAGLYDLSSVKKHRPPENQLGYQGIEPTSNFLRHLTGWRWMMRKFLPESNDPLVRQWLTATQLVVPFSTRTETGEDPLSEPIIETLGANALVLGHGAWDQKSARPHLGIIQKIARAKYKNIYAVWARLTITKADRQKWSRVINIIEKAAGAKLSKYRPFPAWVIHNYLSEARFYKKIFSRIPIRHLFIVNANSMNLMGALKEIGVPTIELQNGLFSEYGLQFSWPGRPVIKYLPTEVWTWGKIWTEGVENAINQTVRVIGATEKFEEAREQQKSGAENWKRKSGRVTVMSQPYLASQLLEAAKTVARKNPKSEVIFKAHPRDSIELLVEIL